jgi:hypothetical protein
VSLLFAGYGIWCVILHGMPMPKSKVGGGALLGFFLVV